MRIQSFRLSLPLLGKDLVEQAARKRTYAIRVAYATLLFAFFGVFLYEKIGRFGDSPLGWLGSGKEMFEVLVALQFGGIYLFLPATAAGAITAEKERDTLGLLFLTPMRPGEIILQKFLGRLVPALTFLLLSLPLLAVSYALGGVTADRVGWSAWWLFLSCLQVAAFAILCSAFCRGTVGAVLASYLGLVIIYFGPIFIRLTFGTSYLRSGEEDVLFAMFPVFHVDEFSRRGSSYSGSVAILTSITLFLLLARTALIRRSFLTPRNLLLDWFRKLDRFLHGINQWVGGIIVVRSKGDLPGDAPVAWRGTTKSVLGQTSHLIRLFLLLEVPTVLAISGNLPRYGGGNAEELSVILFVLWGVAVLLLSVIGVGAVASERTRQTLDVLLTTPLSGADILRQKMAGVRRVWRILALPMLTVLVAKTWWEGSYHREFAPILHHLIPAVLTILIYLPLISWLAIWFGMRVRSRIRAMLGTATALILWVTLPIAILFVADEVLHWIRANQYPWAFAFLLSPGTAVVAAEYSWSNGWENLFGEMVVLSVAADFLLYGLILYYLRRTCLAKADRLLGRGQ